MIPSLSVHQTEPSFRRKAAPALSSPPKPQDPSRSPSTNHLNPTGTSESRLARCAATRSIIELETRVFPDTGLGLPAWAVLEEIPDSHGQIVVRGEQACAPGHDAVAVRVRVVPKGDVELVLESDQAGHGVRGGAVHPDLAVLVYGHEAEGRVHDRVDHLDVEAEPFGNRLPEADTRPSEGVHADLQARPGDRLHVEDVLQVLYVRAHVIVLSCRVRGQGLLERDPAHVLRSPAEDFVRPVLDRLRGFRVRRASMGGIVLEAPVVRGIVGGGDDDPIGPSARLATVVGQDGVGDDGRGRVAVSLLNHDRNAVGGKDLEGGCKGRLGQGVGVLAHEKGTVDSLVLPELGNCLGDGQDVVLVEARLRRASPVTGRPEGDLLGRIGDVGPVRIIQGDEPGDVDEQIERRRPPGQRRNGHGLTSFNVRILESCPIPQSSQIEKIF